MTFTPENTGTVRVVLADYQRILKEREQLRAESTKRGQQVEFLCDVMREMMERLRDPSRGVATPGILCIDALRAIERWDEDRAP